MAKGQKRGNREAKKPKAAVKKQAAAACVPLLAGAGDARKASGADR